MLVLRDRESIAGITHADLRAHIERRVLALAEFDDFELHELVIFVVVEPGDAMSAIDAQLGFSILGDADVTPAWELIEEHPGYFEIVYVLSDDGFGLDVFIPKHPDVPPELLAMCAAFASPAEEL